MAEHVTLETALSPAAEIQFHQGGPISATWLNGSTVEVFVVYSDAGGLKIASSTDGGKTYGETTITTTTGLIGQTVWYDRWTPGDTTGNLLHIAVSNPANEQIKYFSWNLSTHSAGSTTDVLVFTASSIAGISATPDGNTSICKAANGKIYIGVQCTSPSFSVYYSNDSGSTWSTAGTPGSTAVDDQFILLPCSTTDDIMLLKMISASNFMRSRIWDDSASTWLTEFTVATSVGDADQKELYPNMFSATLDKTTGNIFLIYKAVTEAILFERFIASTATWETHQNNYVCNIVTNSGMAIQRDQTNGILVVFFMVGNRVIADYNALHITHSSDNGTTWSHPKRILTNSAPHRWIGCHPIINNTIEGWYCTFSDYQNQRLDGIDYNSAIGLSVPATLPYQLVTGNVRDKDRNPLQNAEVAVFKQDYNFRDGIHGNNFVYQGSARTDSNGNYKCLVMNWPDSDKKYQCIVKHGEAQNYFQINSSLLTTSAGTLYLQKFSNLVVGKQLYNIRFYVDNTETPENIRIKAYTDVSGNPDSLLGESDSVSTTGYVRTAKFSSPITIPSDGIVWIGLETQDTVLAFIYSHSSQPVGNNKTVAHTYGPGPSTISSPSDTTLGMSIILVGDFIRMDATIGELKD